MPLVLQSRASIYPIAAVWTLAAMRKGLFGDNLAGPIVRQAIVEVSTINTLRVVSKHVRCVNFILMRASGPLR